MENLKLTQDFRSLQSEKTVSGLLAVQFNSYQIECFFEAMGLYRTLDLNSNPMDSTHSRIISNERQTIW